MKLGIEIQDKSCVLSSNSSKILDFRHERYESDILNSYK